MNYDAVKMAEVAEQARHNREAEEAERLKAKAALRTANVKAADTFVSGATGLGKLIGVGAKLAGKNSPDWAKTGDPTLDEVYKQSYVKLDLRDKALANGIKLSAPVVLQDYYPVIGRSTGSTVGPEFLVFKSIYNIMRGHNRGATNYTIADLAGYLLTIASTVATLATYERIHKIFANPDLNMRVTIHEIADTLGLNYASINANLADFETRIARVKSILNELPCPVDFPVLKRWLWLNSFVFRDKPERNSSLIIMRPQIRYAIDPTNYRLVCKVEGTGINRASPNASNTYATITANLEQLEGTLGVLMDSTTHQAVAGDILNAFNGHLIDWSATPLGSESPYYYDEEFLLEWTNGRLACSYQLTSTAERQFEVTFDRNGKFGQGFLINNSGDGFHGIYATVRDTYLTYGAAGTASQLIFTDGHEELTDDQTAMAISWIPLRNNAAGYTSIVTYSWDLDDLSQTTQHTDTPVTNHKFIELDNYGTELLAPASVIEIEDTGVIRVKIYQDSNEAMNAEDLAYTNALDHYVWRYTFDASNNALIVGTDMDSYADVANDSLKEMIRVKNQAIWGYRTVSALRKSMFSVKQASREGNKSSRYHGGQGNKPKNGAGTPPSDK